MSVEIAKKRIKIKSDCSFADVDNLLNCQSDSMLVINKILSFHSSVLFLNDNGIGCELSLSLNGMLCNEADNS